MGRAPRNSLRAPRNSLRATLGPFGCMLMFAGLSLAFVELVSKPVSMKITAAQDSSFEFHVVRGFGQPESMNNEELAGPLLWKIELKRCKMRACV